MAKAKNNEHRENKNDRSTVMYGLETVHAIKPIRTSVSCSDNMCSENHQMSAVPKAQPFYGERAFQFSPPSQ